MTAVYLAASLTVRDDASALAAELSESSVHVASSWHSRLQDEPSPDDYAARNTLANCCLEDLSAATHLVMLVHRGQPRGAFFEAGFAWASGTPVLWVLGDITTPIFDAFGQRVHWRGVTATAKAIRGWLGKAAE